MRYEIISTLPHYLAILPWLHNLHTNYQNITYHNIVFLSTTLSVLWHLYEEPKYTVLYYADHLGALVWFLYDLELASHMSERARVTIVSSNMLVFILFLVSNTLGKYHNEWHIISALKCIFVSLIATTV